MNMVLKVLGISTKNKKDYNTQFGIVLNKRTIQSISLPDESKLLAESAICITSSLVNTSTDLVKRQDSAADFDVQTGGIDMLLMDIGDGWPQQTQAVLLAASAATRSSDSLYGMIGVCYPASSVEGDLSILSPAASVDVAFATKDYPLYVENYAKFLEISELSAQAKVIQMPQHGILMEYDQKDDERSGSPNVYKYTPNAGYKGADQVIFLVNLAGKQVKVIYFIKIVDVALNVNSIEKIYRKYCPTPSVWLISSVSGVATSWEQSSEFYGHLGKVTLNFSDFPGSELSQTAGTGPTAQITLDDNAAGHAWYIDYTPYLNEEYLPTSNPREWLAKPGSAAEGKMDLLTVLLHEYGHALGLEHTADSHDLMATTLQPGMRRLPSAEGRFRYRPAADWSGEDSFSFKVSDGLLDSNLAAVKLTVRPVNDAPAGAGRYCQQFGQVVAGTARTARVGDQDE